MIDEESRVIGVSWKVQAYDRKMKDWYSIGSNQESLDEAIWYRDKVIQPSNKRTKLRIVETTVSEKVVG